METDRVHTPSRARASRSGRLNLDDTSRRQDVKGNLRVWHVGSHILHPPFTLSLSDPLAVGLSEEGRVYLTDSRMEEFKLMSPYIRHDMCPTCNHPRVLITDGRHQYIDVFMGHRVQLAGI
jgi:hypothetical protein